MFFNKKAQSTAEYAIVIGLVVAVAAGVLSVALKGGIRQKNKQALNLLIAAGNDDGLNTAASQAEALFSQDYRQTTIAEDTFKDQTVMRKGGAQLSHQKQDTTSTSIGVELIDQIPIAP